MGKSASRGSFYSVGIARADVRSPYVSYPCTCTYTPIPVCGEICVWRTYCFSVKCLRICDLNDLISSLSAEHVGFCGLFFLSGFGHLPTRLCCLMINSMIFLHMTIVLNFCKLFKILVFFKVLFVCVIKKRNHSNNVVPVLDVGIFIRKYIVESSNVAHFDDRLNFFKISSHNVTKPFR